MTGMSRETGKPLSGNGHLAQSIGDILTTPIGSRIMRRDYGSMLADLIDRPLNSATRLLVFAATALALRRWEPRLRLTKVAFLVDPSSTGQAILEISGERTDLALGNERVILSIPIRAAGASPAAATT